MSDRMTPVEIVLVVVGVLVVLRLIFTGEFGL